MWDFSTDANIPKIAQSIYERGGVVAAVCHGPAALLNIKLSTGEYLVAGKKVSAFSNDEESAADLTKIMPFLLETELVKRGAQYHKSPLWEAHSEVSERLVTGQNPASAKTVAHKMVALLLGKK